MGRCRRSVGGEGAAHGPGIDRGATRPPDPGRARGPGARRDHREGVRGLLDQITHERRASGTVDEGIRALLRKDLIRPDRGDLGEEDAYRFRHLLVRDAVYDAMPKELRAALHEGFADWLEREARSAAGAGRVRRIPPRAVVSLPGGARSRRRRGTRDRLRAGAHLLAAGERALGRGDVAAAEQLLGRAIELLPADDPRALSAMPSLGQALFFGGRTRTSARGTSRKRPSERRMRVRRRWSRVSRSNVTLLSERISTRSSRCDRR